MAMDNFDKTFTEAFDEALKSMNKEELNNLIEEINNLDSGGEPTINEYFNHCLPTEDKTE